MRTLCCLFHTLEHGAATWSLHNAPELSRLDKPESASISIDFTRQSTFRFTSPHTNYHNRNSDTYSINLASPESRRLWTEKTTGRFTITKLLLVGLGVVAALPPVRQAKGHCSLFPAARTQAAEASAQTSTNQKGTGPCWQARKNFIDPGYHSLGCSIIAIATAQCCTGMRPLCPRCSCSSVAGINNYIQVRVGRINSQRGAANQRHPAISKHF